MLDIIGEKEAVFHRAIDVVPEPLETLEILASLGVKRVLTSGQQPTVREGVPLIAEMVGRMAGRMEILPGGGIRMMDVAGIVRDTGVNQVHVSGSGVRMDKSTAAIRDTLRRSTLSAGGQA
jgi:copper homeostasis protein